MESIKDARETIKEKLEYYRCSFLEGLISKSTYMKLADYYNGILKKMDLLGI